MEAKTELERNAIVTARRKDLEFYQQALDRQWLDSRMANGATSRCLALIQQEAELEKDFQQRTDHAAIVNSRAETETKLGLEIAEMRREEACKLLRRHYLRERDPALRELMKKLQAGYVCRDLKQQILNNEYKRLQEKAEREHANKVLSNALYSDQEALQMEAKDKIERNARHCRDLQQQLVNRQTQKQCQYEDSLIEKKMLDDIMKTIYDEDMRELQQKREITERAKREMSACQQLRAAWRDKQATVAANEARQIEQQAQAAADREAVVIAARQAKMKQREEINESIAAAIMANEAKRQARLDIIEQLQYQECLERAANEAAREEQVTTDTKRLVHETLTAQMRLKQERKRQEESPGEDLVAIAKFRAEEEKERLKAMKEKEKKQQYALELKQQIRDNERRRKERREMEDMDAKRVFEAHKAWHEKTVRERATIIEDHVPKLIGHLAAGVVQKEDLPTIQAGANKDPQLAQLDIQSLTQKNRPKRFSKCNAQCRILREN